MTNPSTMNHPPPFSPHRIVRERGGVHGDRCLPTVSVRRSAVSVPAVRYGLVRLRENAESVAFYGGEGKEEQLLIVVGVHHQTSAPTLSLVPSCLFGDPARLPYHQKLLLPELPELLEAAE